MKQNSKKNINLYDILSYDELNYFLSQYNTSIEEKNIVEIKEKNLFGDFIIMNKYKFKITNGVYQCMETPTEKHEKQKVNIVKNKGDSINYNK